MFNGWNGFFMERFEHNKSSGHVKAPWALSTKTNKVCVFRRLIQEPESLWARVLKGRYFSKGEVLSAKKGSRALWAWSSLLEGQAVIFRGAWWQISNVFWKLMWRIQSHNGGYSVKSSYAYAYCHIPRGVELQHCRGQAQRSHQISNVFWKLMRRIQSVLIVAVGRPPPFGTIKANFDAAWSNGNREAAMGVILRFSDGFIVNSKSAVCFSKSALESERGRAFMLQLTTISRM